MCVCTCGENSTLRTECVVNSRADYIKIAYNEGGVYYTRIDMVMKKYVGFWTQFLGKFILKHLLFQSISKVPLIILRIRSDQLNFLELTTFKLIEPKNICIEDRNSFIPSISIGKPQALYWSMKIYYTYTHTFNLVGIQHPPT